jgi:hypothetical protein
VAGFVPDARQLVSRARDEARAYRQNYGEPALPRVLAEHMGGFVHLHTVYWYLRPFGASILLAGFDAEARRHELYCVEPTGSALRYFGYAIGAQSERGMKLLGCGRYACAANRVVAFGNCCHSCAFVRPLVLHAGKGARAAKTEIEKHKFEEKTVEEAIGLVAKMWVWPPWPPKAAPPKPLAWTRLPRLRSRQCGPTRHQRIFVALLHPALRRCSIHGVHDDVKDKPFELELSWLSEATGWRHTAVPPERIAAAEAWAKAQIEAEEMGEDDEED